MTTFISNKARVEIKAHCPFITFVKIRNNHLFKQNSLISSKDYQSQKQHNTQIDKHCNLSCHMNLHKLFFTVLPL